MKRRVEMPEEIREKCLKIIADAAQTASKEILVYFKKRQWPEKTEKIFETAAIRDENHVLYQECTLGYLYKHVNNLFGKDRASGIGYYSFYPRTGEYFTNK